MKSRLTLGFCKDCGDEFPLVETARKIDIARGLSEPERCPKCRQSRRQEIRSDGAIFAEPPKQFDNSVRCWGKYGLAYVKRKPLARIPVPDESVSVDLPLLYLENPGEIQTQRDLDIAEKFSRIAPAAEALVRNLEDPNGTRVSVLIGPTGTGKSTWAPYRLLKSKIGDHGRICVTQPRLVTLRKQKGRNHKGLENDSTTPGYIARELLRTTGVGAGHEIGFQYSGEYDQQDRYTKLLYVTDGTLINWLQDGRIGQFDVVFVDEAHEQSSNMEQIFALLKYRLPLYPRLRVVIASATADVDRFRDYFGNGDKDTVFLAAPDSETCTTLHLIHDRSLEDWQTEFVGLSALCKVTDPSALRKMLPEVLIQLVNKIRTDPSFTRLGTTQGDILIFVPTVGLANSISDKLKNENENLNNIVVCHAQCTESELKSFKESEQLASDAEKNDSSTKPARIILATNYAETSVTLANVRYVIDSGLILQPDWDPETASSRFDVKWHSKAGCTQRKGRVGRTQAGEYFRLFSQVAFAEFPDHTPPDLTRQPLDSFLLSVKAAGIEHLQSFKWLSRQSASKGESPNEFNRAVASISKRDALDANGDITQRGIELGQLRTPRVELAACLALADRFACAFEVATMIAFVGQRRSPFVQSEDGLLGFSKWRTGCFDDLEFYFRLFYHWWNTPVNKRDQWAKNEGLSSEYFQDVLKQRDASLASLQRKDSKKNQRNLDLARLYRVRLIIAKCVLEWAYILDTDSPSSFDPVSANCPCRLPIRIDRDSACLSKPGLEAFVCLERISRGNKLFARHIVCVEKDHLQKIESASLPGVALLFSELNAGSKRSAEQTRDAICQLPPRPTQNQFCVGDMPDTLRFVRSISSEEVRVVLAECAKTGFPVLVSGVKGFLEAGDIFRAIIEDNSAEAAKASHTQIRNSYRDLIGKSFSGTVLNKATYKGLVNKLWVRLEPGVDALLHKQDMHVGAWGLLQNPAVGQRLEVSLKSASPSGDLYLETLEYAKRSEDAFELGQRHKGFIKEVAVQWIKGGYDLTSSTSISQVKVEITPGRVGLLELNDKIVRNLQFWRVGEPIDIVVADTNETPALNLAKTEMICKRGQAFKGKVTGIDTANGRVNGAFVKSKSELIGYLPASLFPSEVDCEPIDVGKNLDVVIGEFEIGSLPQLGWLPPLQKGGRGIGRIVDEIIDDSGRTSFHVDIGPLHAFLPTLNLINLPSKRPLKVGSQIKFCIDEIQRNEQSGAIEVFVQRVRKIGIGSRSLNIPSPSEKRVRKRYLERRKSIRGSKATRTAIPLFKLFGILLTKEPVMRIELPEFSEELGFKTSEIKDLIVSNETRILIESLQSLIFKILSGTSLANKKKAALELQSHFQNNSDRPFVAELKAICFAFLLDHGRNPLTGEHVAKQCRESVELDIIQFEQSPSPPKQEVDVIRNSGSSSSNETSPTTSIDGMILAGIVIVLFVILLFFLVKNLLG